MLVGLAGTGGSVTGSASVRSSPSPSRVPDALLPFPLPLFDPFFLLLLFFFLLLLFLFLLPLLPQQPFFVQIPNTSFILKNPPLFYPQLYAAFINTSLFLPSFTSSLHPYPNHFLPLISHIPLSLPSYVPTYHCLGLILLRTYLYH